MLTKRVLCAFSMSLKRKVREYYKGLSFLTTPVRHVARGCVLLTCSESIFFSWRLIPNCHDLVWGDKNPISSLSKSNQHDSVC